MKTNYLVAISLFIGLTTACNDDDTKNPEIEFSGTNMLTKVSVTRDKKTKTATLTLTDASEWKLYGGSSDQQIDLSEPIAKGSKSGSFTLSVPTDTRSYFLLETPDGKAILAERQLPMTGGYNFRDMGGFRTKDGRYTRWGQVFRSDELKSLTDADMTYLSSLPLTTIVDFRSESEISEAPDRIPDSVKERIELCITPGSLSDLPVEQILSLTEEEADATMVDINTQLVNDPRWIAQYKAFFALLQNPEKTPLIYHCTAGKDRTGYASFLFLTALGVDQETCMNDYLVSNIYLEDKYGIYIQMFPFLRALIEVKAKYLQTAIDSIITQYGDVETYLTEVLDVDIDRMRELYLY
ncbi:MAG: tyrosine-protein phosphatase [Tannerellaceae bacterium]|nr:tyrosine-protein phosphatase [Tannerellaceae bacterium]